MDGNKVDALQGQVTNVTAERKAGFPDSNDRSTNRDDFPAIMNPAMVGIGLGDQDIEPFTVNHSNI